jgi:hypothetical protein
LVIVKQGATIVVRAKNIRHAILIFDKKFGHDLQWALLNEDYSLEQESN